MDYKPPFSVFITLALSFSLSCGGGGGGDDEGSGGSGGSSGNNGPSIKATPNSLTWNIEENDSASSKTIILKNIGDEEASLNVTKDALDASEGILILSGEVNAQLPPNASATISLTYTPPENVSSNESFSSKINQDWLTTPTGTIPLTFNVNTSNSFGEFDLPEDTDQTTITSAWVGLITTSNEQEIYWAGQTNDTSLSNTTPIIAHAHGDAQANQPPSEQWAFSYPSTEPETEQGLNAVVGLSDGGAVAVGFCDQTNDQGAWAIKVNDDGSIGNWTTSKLTDPSGRIAEFLGITESINNESVIAVGSLYAPGPGIAVEFDYSGNVLNQIELGAEDEDVDIESVIELNDGYLLLGRVLESGAAIYAGLAIKIDSSFQKVWEHSYAANENLSLINAIENQDLDITLIGESYSNSGPTVTDIIHIANDGSINWKKQYAILGQDEVCNIYSIVEKDSSLWCFGHTDISNGAGGYTNLPLILKIQTSDGAIQVERNFSNTGDSFFATGTQKVHGSATFADFMLAGIVDGENQNTFAVYGNVVAGEPTLLGGNCDSLKGADQGIVNASSLSLNGTNRTDDATTLQIGTLTTSSLASESLPISISSETTCPN